MAKKVAKQKVKRESFTFKGDDLEMVMHALALLADISHDMLEDTSLSPEERGMAGFDEQHCRDLLKKIEEEEA